MDDPISLALAKAKKDSQQAHETFQRNFQFVVWAVGGLILGTISATVWVLKIQARVESLEVVKVERMALVDRELAKFNTYITTHDLAFAGLTNRVEAQAKRSEGIDARLTEMVPTLKNADTMWNLRQLGVNNDTAFFLDKGFWPRMSVRPNEQPPSPSPSPK